MHAVTSGTTTTVRTTATPTRAVPSLVTRVRLATSLEDPRWTRGAARRAPGGGETPSLWNTSALMSCLLLAAGHRTAPGPSQDLPARFLDREFGRSRVTRFEDVDFPGTLHHEPTRRFLRQTGLPEDAHPFRLDRDPDDLPLPTLAEYCEEFPGRRAPDRAAHLIRLGRLASGDHVVVDGTTGAVLTWRAPDDALHPLVSDVSALALTLWALRRATLLEAVAGFEPA
ncbi:SUKH-4 family immunity protein [Streptomyces lancefieldiae]|uniref:SUKH-4 family immunity protein n=1 Tax=Streptomyces lancefieldiae TaxID=3075520 RepID=A0ABU3AS76_9ACTN|nr:SUKH-4 family immunity protein [Streptomyces sp. DSM 40712]MDT0613047.1 SUKH-4 family immunity protein [Streptomyces sp. DSM 40712]